MCGVQSRQKRQRNKKNAPQVIVLGAGASGMVAAIAAARKGRRVLILEHKDKPGKKLYATGNGKCNFTNEHMSVSCFHGDHLLVEGILGEFGHEETLAFFHEIGILPLCRDGYYYPYSQTAASVVQALTMELERLGILLVTGVDVTEIRCASSGRFELQTNLGRYEAGRLVIATGLLASPALGSDGSAMDLIKTLGHRFTPVVPALCAFSARGMNFREAAGVRARAAIRLFVDGELAAEDAGELQLTDYGISGIPVFQVSRHASMALCEKRLVTAELDFFPELTERALAEELAGRFRGLETVPYAGTGGARLRPEWTVEKLLNGLLNPKLFSSLLKKARIPSGNSCSDVTEEDLRRLASVMKRYPVTLMADRGFTHAQVCAGGIRHGEVNPETLESQIHPGLFFCGEVLDVDGICGGYNLQWAWSSGMVAGRNAAGRISYREHRKGGIPHGAEGIKQC